MARPAPDRDPAARSRLIGTLSALVILWPLFQAAEVKPGALFDAVELEGRVADRPAHLPGQFLRSA